MRSPVPVFRRLPWPGLFLGGLIAAGAASGAPSGSPSSLERYLAGADYFALSLERNADNQLVIRGQVAGETPQFMVDTGWSITGVRPALAKKLPSLGALKAKLKDSFLGLVDDPEMVLLERLELGKAQFLNQPALPIRAGWYARFPEDGVLGCDFLWRNFCLLDCLERRLYVRGTEPTETVREAFESTLRRSRFTRVPLRVTESLVPTCEAEINGRRVRLLVDSGAVWTLLDSGFANRAGLPDQPTAHAIAGVGKASPQPLRVARLRTLRLGSREYKSMDVGVSDLGGWGLAERGRNLEEVQGLLGSDFLARQGALIDCHGEALWLRAQAEDR